MHVQRLKKGLYASNTEDSLFHTCTCIAHAHVTHLFSIFLTMMGRKTFSFLFLLRTKYNKLRGTV